MSITTKAQRHKSVVFLCAFVFLLLTTVLAQAPTFEGNWYGTISPPGAQFDIAVRLQLRGDIWTGTLLLENGTNIPLREIVPRANAISFSLDPGPQKITFKGALSDNGTELSGDFTQDTSTFPFKLSRTPTAALQGA